MDTLNICLCKVCNCKDWKIKIENENIHLKNENNLLKTQMSHFFKFDKCDICNKVDQYLICCWRCDIRLCDNCYSILDKNKKSKVKDLLITFQPKQFEQFGIDAFSLCKHMLS